MGNTRTKLLVVIQKNVMKQPKHSDTKRHENTHKKHIRIRSKEQ